MDRVLVIDPNVANAKMLAQLMRSLWPSVQIYGARDGQQGLALAAEVQPQLVFVESSGPALDGVAFSRALRRSDLQCREAAIVMISGEATAALILGARDAGVHEFMRRPYNLGDLEKRLEAVSGRPRDWVEAMNYIGPDRRRFNSADYKGPRKRRTDGSGKSQRINQALKITQAAAAAVDADPVQALRALATQARMLIELSAGQEGYRRMGSAATHMQTYLQAIAQQGAPLSKAQVETLAATLLMTAPDEVRPKAA